MAAYTVSQIDIAENGYSTDLWIYDGEKCHQATSGHSEKMCIWSRDGSSLLFPSGRDKPADGTTRFYSLDVTSCGEARELFTIEKKASLLADLGNGRYLISAILSPDFDNPEDADYMVITQLPFLANGRGFVCQERNALGIFDTETGSFTRLSPEFMDVETVHVCSDCNKAILIARDYVDVKPTFNHVYVLDLESGKISCKSGGIDFNFKDARPYKGEILVTGCDQKVMGVNSDSSFFILKDGGLTCFTPEFESSLRNSVGSDCRYNEAATGGKLLIDGGDVYFSATENYRGGLFRFSENKKPEDLTPGIASVDEWDVKNGRVLFTGFEGLNLTELYLLDENGTITRLTRHNDDALHDLRLSCPKHVTFDNGEGWTLDGWYMKPVDYEEGKKYPTILNIHGGPKCAFGDIFFHEMQYWTSLGFAVIYCNPRGGDGRGNGFDDIRCVYGVKDYHDIMAFTDWCVENLPFVDEKRMGVTGGSYGGYMTNWIITQTDRFKAACAQRPISNWVSKCGSCDIGYYYVPDQIGRAHV